MSTSLGQKAAHGAAWSVAGQAATAVLNLVSVAILARLIMPEEFGLVAMVTAFVSLGELVRDLGLTNAVLHAPKVTTVESSNLFWVNTGIGLALSLILIGLSYPITQFYGQPELAGIIYVISLTFLLNGIATQPRALLARNLRFKSLALLDVTSLLVGVVTGVAMASTGMGYWALVGLQVGRSFSIAFWALLLSRITIGLPDLSVSIRFYLHFGSRLLAAQVLGYVCRNMDVVLIGRSLGSSASGIYSRALQLGFVPIQQATAPLSRVALPILSRLSNDRTEYDRFLLRGMMILFIPTALGYAVLIVLADVTIRIGLGAGWDAAVPVFRWICLAGMMECASYINYWIFVSRGLPNRHLQFALISRPLLLLAIVVTVPHGINAVAAAIAIWTALAWPAGLLFASRFTPLPTREMLNASFRVYGVSLLVIAAGSIFRASTSFDNGAIETLSSLGIIAAVIAGCLIFVRAFRQDFLEMLHSVQLVMVPQRKLPRSSDL